MPIKVLHLVGVLSSPHFPWAQPFVADQIESLRRLGLEVDVLDLSTCGTGIKKYLVGIGKLKRLVSANHYDLIHAHYSYCGWVARFQRYIPVIVSLMGSDLLGTPDKHGRQTLRGYFDIISSQMLASWVDRLIVKSNGMAKLVHYKDQISVIPNGVDFEEFKPRDRSTARAQLGVDLHKKVILFAANPEDPRKNYRLADEATHIVQSQNKNSCVLLPFYKRSHAEVSIAMNAADVLVMTSFWEGSPNIVKEAMACNLPIVSVRAGDVPEVIAGVQNCYLADYDATDVAAKIDLVIQSGQRSDGRQHIDYLRMDVVAMKLFDVYREVLNSRHPD